MKNLEEHNIKKLEWALYQLNDIPGNTQHSNRIIGEIKELAKNLKDVIRRAKK